MLDHGHPEATSYPIGLIWFEAQIIKDRENSLMASQSSLFNQAMIAAIDSMFGGKDAIKSFNQVINNLAK